MNKGVKKIGIMCLKKATEHTQKNLSAFFQESFHFVLEKYLRKCYIEHYRDYTIAQGYETIGCFARCVVLGLALTQVGIASTLT